MNSIAPSTRIKRRRLILNSAIKLFARRGFFSAKTKDIARDSGCSEGTIFNYFGSKDELLIAIFESIWSELIPAIRTEMQKTDDPDQQMQSILSGILDLFRGNQDLAKVFLIELKRSREIYNQRPIRLYDETLELIGDVLRLGVDKGLYRPDLDLALLPVVFYGSVEGVLTLWVMKGKHQQCDHRIDLDKAYAVLMDSYERIVSPE